MMHNICLNIHYSAPEEIWEKIGDVYSSMPYWYKDQYPHWVGDNIDISASVESGGIQIRGEMPSDLWDSWYDTLKKRLSDVLGYEIGEPEYGYEFKYWEPFEKQYSDIKLIDSKKIVFNDYATFFWEQFEFGERDITASPPYFVFKSSYIELRIYFDEAKMIPQKKRIHLFRSFQRELKEYGISTLDLS